MMQLVYVLIVITLSLIGVSSPVSAYGIQQWIAPIECVENYGQSSQRIMSKEECNDKLRPEELPHKPVSGGVKTPVDFRQTLQNKHNNLQNRYFYKGEVRDLSYRSIPVVYDSLSNKAGAGVDGQSLLVIISTLLVGVIVFVYVRVIF